MRKHFMRAVVFTLACVLGTHGLAAAVRAQGSPEVPPPAKLVKIIVPPITVNAGDHVTAHVTLDVASGWHINANPPSPDYMVPTDVSIEGAGGVSTGTPRFPKGRGLKLDFDESELSVYDGSTATIDVEVAASAQAANGAHPLVGQLRFQACNNHLCLAPVALPFTLAVTVTGGVAKGVTMAAPPAAADTLHPASPSLVVNGATPGATVGANPTPGPRGAGFATAPPATGARPALLDNPLARALDKGGFAAFLTLFLIGLALNLTPCVYPMLGVTVSIFGARRAAPPLQVFGLALIYVLGMALMYSALGLVAAFTGGLFGGFLQNPMVLVVIGLLLLGMSLSMFGVYEIQMPAAIRERASAVSATSVAGVFMSGLVVGVFAAPCIGPPVVALLAIVGAKADPWFGFISFFTLAMGLGLPYLVLGTFSNLLQTLPRSGDWMEWVKKLFGVILVAIGLFYVLLGVKPVLATWILPIALVGGGAYLGYIDTHADRRKWFRWFKRVGGAAAVVGGLALVAMNPRDEIVMKPFTPAALQAALANGQVVMVDFSAEWCVPCHELDRTTFTDRRVIDASRSFALFKADLTRYDAPEAEAWRRQYGITGVPTVLFLTPSGHEVFAARVEGFLAADRFIERMDLALETAKNGN